MNITVLYGTESGNSELIAEYLGSKLRAAIEQVEVFDLQNFDPAAIDPKNFYLVGCSTHGDGELPNTAIPFAEAFD